MGQWPTVRLRWLDIGQVFPLFVCVNLQKKNKANTGIKKKTHLLVQDKYIFLSGK